MIRITTNGTLLGYKANLQRSSSTLSAARDKVLSQRNFNSYAEDPAAATQAFKLRRSYSRVSNQLTNNQALVNKYQAAYDSLNTVKSDLTEKSGKVSALYGLNASTGSGRQPLGTVLSSAAQSIVQTMNAEYGGSFIFAGNDALDSAPFNLTANDDGSFTLTYRGVNVDAADSSAIYQQLTAMNGEAAYVDVGAGLTEEDGSVIASSAFNSALSGIEYLGYGLDDEGDPKNVVSIMNKISTIFSRCNASSGDYASDADAADAERLSRKLEDALSHLTSKWTSLSGQTTYLTSNAKRLTSMSDDLNMQILDLEQVNLASAITDFSWAQYCYNAALKSGNSILSQSLIDYMN